MSQAAQWRYTPGLTRVLQNQQKGDSGGLFSRPHRSPQAGTVAGTRLVSTKPSDHSYLTADRNDPKADYCDAYGKGFVDHCHAKTDRSDTHDDHANPTAKVFSRIAATPRPINATPTTTVVNPTAKVFSRIAATPTPISPHPRRPL